MTAAQRDYLALSAAAIPVLLVTAAAVGERLAAGDVRQAVSYSVGGLSGAVLAALLALRPWRISGRRRRGPVAPAPDAAVAPAPGAVMPAPAEAVPAPDAVLPAPDAVIPAPDAVATADDWLDETADAVADAAVATLVTAGAWGAPDATDAETAAVPQ